MVWPKVLRFVSNKCTNYKLVFVRLWQFKLLLKSQDALQGSPTCAVYMLLPTSLLSQVDPTHLRIIETTIRQTCPTSTTANQILILVSFALAHSHFLIFLWVFCFGRWCFCFKLLLFGAYWHLLFIGRWNSLRVSMLIIAFDASASIYALNAPKNSMGDEAQGEPAWCG